MTRMREVVPDSSAFGVRVTPLVGPVSGSNGRSVPIPVRALLVDVTILVVGMTCYVWAMVEANRLYRSWTTVGEAAGLALGWILLILFHGGYDAKYVGAGTDEFKRVVNASITLLAAVSTVAYIFLPESPPLRLVIPSLAIGLLLLLMGRWLLHIWLGHKRVKGAFLTTVLVVGDLERCTVLIDAFTRDPQAGYRAVAWIEPPDSGDSGEVVGWLDVVGSWVHSHQVGAVALANGGGLDPELIRRLAWRLEGPRVDLLVSPILHDVAGPRLTVRPAAGLPLLHLDEPVLTGPKRFLKRGMDLVLVLPTLVLLAPVFAAVAIAIKVDSRGPAFYVSRRVGRAGEPFVCWKFRTMRVGADLERAAVIGRPDGEIIERYRHDPRITRVGRHLRRWSLDELPQCLNVLGGSMSLVGPRPVLPEELEFLCETDLRRHITKPGLTGIWQISGRKEVSWEERMTMDLYYVEHWSLPLDVVILVKTIRAVLARRGAY